MLLGTISSDGTAKCIGCNWEKKAPTHRREGREKIELTREERGQVLEELLLYHLKDGHDRLLLTKEAMPEESDSLFPRAYYFGRPFGRRR